MIRDSKHKKSVIEKIWEMEDIRDILFHQIDIVIARDYATMDLLTKIELQAKLLSLNVVAPESFLTVLKLPKKDLIELILGMNLYYTEDDQDNMSEIHEENDMDENNGEIGDDQHDNHENNFYNYYGGMNNYQQYWQYNQHYYQDQEQWQQWQQWQQYQ